MAVGFAEAEANNLLDEFRSQTLWMRLHTGDPGSDGTANQASEDTRVQVTFDAASGGVIELSDGLDWTDVASTEDYSHFSLWSDEADGTFKASGNLTADEVDSGGNFSIAAGDLTVSLNVAA